MFVAVGTLVEVTWRWDVLSWRAICADPQRNGMQMAKIDLAVRDRCFLGERVSLVRGRELAAAKPSGGVQAEADPEIDLRASPFDLVERFGTKAFQMLDQAVYDTAMHLRHLSCGKCRGSKSGRVLNS